ncbi:alkaline and neutral invertase-like protein [Mucilaginibacter frigoritolerans]|uniref:beta-fructofuranosidase n=1 Tax=Mucilaginibacter frigoritolerans TaxID=652788 RepID=A0A562UC75_9SPHI|nr:glycoside hydrolase 100 family protein [Mucilaginibacter frigoritolerans]TWJ03424.1 alkaline and neutral invertase-like protein [Mucilaginibacter frigoritolerans]
MTAAEREEIEAAKKSALEVLLHNANGPFHGLPRTAGWGYPEPYTRDLMFSIFGIAVSGNQLLINSIRLVLQTLAENQTEHGHIVSLVHEKDDRGASDTTPLFLVGVGIFRKLTGEADFLDDAVSKALTWMEYQSPSDRYLIAQQPTSDWRDEQWVLGLGLFVNTLTYTYLKLLDQHERAEQMRKEIKRPTIDGGFINAHEHEGLEQRNKPYFAFWSYKVYYSDKFDLLGNSIAILSGITSPERAEAIIDWVETECGHMQQTGDLKLNLPPNFFPFTLPGDADWLPRYENFNLPGNYHNGGIWPFICGFYVAALVAAKKYDLAEQKLIELTKLVKLSQDPNLPFGFNEWIKAQDGKVRGVDWQTWSAALYLYAAKCVEDRGTPYFDEMRA